MDKIKPKTEMIREREMIREKRKNEEPKSFSIVQFLYCPKNK